MRLSLCSDRSNPRLPQISSSFLIFRPTSACTAWSMASSSERLGVLCQFGFTLLETADTPAIPCGLWLIQHSCCCECVAMVRCAVLHGFGCRVWCVAHLVTDVRQHKKVFFALSRTTTGASALVDLRHGTSATYRSRTPMGSSPSKQRLRTPRDVRYGLRTRDGFVL